TTFSTITMRCRGLLFATTILDSQSAARFLFLVSTIRRRTRPFSFSRKNGDELSTTTHLSAGPCRPRRNNRACLTIQSARNRFSIQLAHASGRRRNRLLNSIPRRAPISKISTQSCLLQTLTEHCFGGGKSLRLSQPKSQNRSRLQQQVQYLREIHQRLHSYSGARWLVHRLAPARSCLDPYEFPWNWISRSADDDARAYSAE